MLKICNDTGKAGRLKKGNINHLGDLTFNLKLMKAPLNIVFIILCLNYIFIFVQLDESLLNHTCGKISYIMIYTSLTLFHFHFLHI